MLTSYMMSGRPWRFLERLGQLGWELTGIVHNVYKLNKDDRFTLVTDHGSWYEVEVEL